MINELFANKIFPNETLAVFQRIENKIFDEKGIVLDVKREDLIHPYLSGNKWRKLKYNLAEAKKLQKSRLLTLGGAYSNHIYATAAAGKLFGFDTIGIIRGEELAPDNDTLTFAKQLGMKFKFISREAYRNKHTTSFLDNLKFEFGDFYFLPEGGTNELAIKGCEEILSSAEFKKYDFIAVMIGTGGTFSGILNASNGQSHILGISALKGEFIYDTIVEIRAKFQLIQNSNYTI